MNEESQILYDRDPRRRACRRWLRTSTLDSDPYPSIVDGRIVWIIDGYTAERRRTRTRPAVSLSEAISGLEQPRRRRCAIDEINYIRNSVKATVDAYDGSVTLYAWDEEDPVLQAWQKVYPSSLEPISKMSADLMSHVRYPTDLFKVQRQILGVYHVDDARARSARQRQPVADAERPAAATAVMQPPYYLTMQMPGQETPTVSRCSRRSSRPLRARAAIARNVLMGYLAVDSDAGS